MEITIDGGKVITAHINGHSIRTDQIEKAGGQNSAPSPFELFLASIGTCAGIYIKSFCDQRGIPAENIVITQEMVYNHKTGLPEEIKLDIHLPEDFPDKYREAVVSVAELCKVKQTLANPPVFRVRTVKI